ncbi:MAG: AcrB/AcrD/AcrF family protein [Candidatus Eisenbacteria bacterium]|nr:AcrB/AcrD/AcrF family protein [Candidatus Eisenbacteria bacterium]
MHSFFAYFANRHMLANVFTVLVILLGIGSALQIRRDLFPNVDFGEMVITTRYPGASPEDVELNVTNAIEEELKTVSNIDQITSYSMENLSIVVATIDVDASDKEQVKSDIREAVTRVAELPDEVTEAPLVTEISSEIIPIIEVGIAGNRPYGELRETARLFKKKLESIPGVSRVEDSWYLDREVRIEISPDAIREYQISLEEIARAVGRRNIRSTGGAFDSYTSEKSLVTLAQFDSPSQAADVIVRSSFEGPVVRISDLGTVRDTYEEARIISRINGVPAISFSVLKKRSADIIRTDAAVKALLEREKEQLPEGIEILFTNDQSYYVKNRFSVVLTNGLIGLALVLLFLALFLNNLRTAFWVALSIPVTLLGVVFLLPVAGAHLDVIGLTAMLIVIGVIVDDSIIVSENIVARREKGDSPAEAAARGTGEVFKPVVTTMVTTFLAFAPMFFMKGVSGTFVFVIPLVISLALLISVLEVVIALPGHLKPGLGSIRVGSEQKGQWFDAIRRLFRPIIYRVLRLRYLFILFSVLLFAGSIWYTINHMQFILFPSTAANIFNIYVELPIGSSIEKTADQVAEIEGIVGSIPEEELASFATKVGTHGEREPGEQSHWAMITVDLTPFAQRSRTAAEIVDALREDTAGLEGFERITYSIDAGGPPVGEPITLRVIGSDDGLRRALTDSTVARLESIGGVQDIDRNDKLGKEQIALDIDYLRLARLGLTVADVARTLRIAFDGEVVTDVRYGEEDVDFRLTLETESEDSLEDLRELLIPNDQGRLITLGTVADFVTRPGPANVYHFDRERATTITADLAEGGPTPVQVTDSVVDHFDLAQDWPGMRFAIGGEAEETAESFQGLYIAFGIAVIAIYLVLVLLFNSVTQPFIVMVAIPMGIIGVIIAFALHGQPLSFLALMGLIGLSGVAVNDSLVMVNHINDLRRRHPDEPVLPVIAQGATDRLRAIVMTTLTTAVGLIPLVYGIGGSDPFIAPMALALGYGLLFATPLTVGFVPCMYAVRIDVLNVVSRIFRRRRS